MGLVKREVWGNPCVWRLKEAVGVEENRWKETRSSAPACQ